MAILSGRTGAIALCFAVFAGGAAAQDGDESTNRVATETAWSVFVEDDADRKFRCWGVSAPRETTSATRPR